MNAEPFKALRWQRRTPVAAETTTEPTAIHQASPTRKPADLLWRQQEIGDPDRIIPTGILQGTKCIDAFDDGKYGALATVCGQAQNLIQSYCRCVAPGVYVKPCIPLESEYCDKSDSSDRCCAGSCKYLKSKGGVSFTERPGAPTCQLRATKGRTSGLFLG
jgi:hypothetical protein